MARTMLKLLGVSLMLVATVMMGPANGMRTLVGGKSEVKDVESNQEVQELGRYCVEEFSRRQQSMHGKDEVFEPLAFSRVVEAQRQVVAGNKYFLRIEVDMPGGITRMFDSVVVVKPWVQSKELLEFAPIADSLF